MQDQFDYSPVVFLGLKRGVLEKMSCTEVGYVNLTGFALAQAML